MDEITPLVVDYYFCVFKRQHADEIPHYYMCKCKKLFDTTTCRLLSNYYKNVREKQIHLLPS